jgi:hypothetical protein
LFLELDASASKSPIQQSPSSANLNRQTPRQHSQVGWMVLSLSKANEDGSARGELLCCLRGFLAMHSSGILSPLSPTQTVVSNDDIVRSDVKVEDVQIETADIVSKFKFFETYRPEQKEKKQFRITPPRDGVAKVVALRQANVNFVLIFYEKLCSAVAVARV